MKIKANSFLSLGLAVVTLALGFVTSPVKAMAQDTILASARIPFSFHANTVVMPAGTYVIARETASILKLTQRETGKAVLVSVIGDDKTTSANAGSLVFAKTGDQYFMRHLNVPHQDLAYKCVRIKKQEELIRSMQTTSATEVSVNTAPGTTR